MFSALGYLISAHMQRRQAEAYCKSHMPRVVWRKTVIPHVPRKAP